MKSKVSNEAKRLIAAYRNSVAGLKDIWRMAAAFRLEVVALGVLIVPAFLLGTSVGEVALLIGSMLALIIVEILNTAIEAVVDRVGSEIHDLSRLAKDLGSAAVLLTAVFPILIWTAFALRAFGLLSF